VNQKPIEVPNIPTLSHKINIEFNTQDTAVEGEPRIDSELGIN
jgi:hypothetical protein